MADKKLFELEVGTPATSDKLAYGKAGSVYKNITYGDFKALIIAAVPPPPAPDLLTKVINIGAYDMAGGDRNKDVVLTGINRTKIRSIVVNILSNSSGIYPMASPAGNDELRSWWRVYDNYTNPARIKLYSENNSYFDQAPFDGNGPSNNRGYIYVTYIP